ncbi:MULTISPECIES: NADPH:quinone oxidoreductase family protein [unclassified Methylibium]|uniref:NADPH:quinone oxidoreductase family protein n=1 Tax=unclassified Methylibium TaxID=2633235 RepID=UPI0003F43469|nr:MULTISPECIES: NADPH:quinone oxidoreductase family protein [unclassified Methylibium]EWS56469.1 Beta-ketoacyl-acyl-carrier-protein synthase I [Methylibium sp. T29]EWS61587.1 Beta-ketoacyl-acyl-carrier-protein synthase I [Methylibium sp. T29-B]
MHAWLCDNPIGPEALKWTELPTPEPQAGEVRVAVRCASLNFPDLLIVQNKYQLKPPLPFVPGAEFSGVIEAVGPGVTQLHVGMAVASFGGIGGFGSHVCVDARQVMPLPSGFAFDDAAAFLCTYGTSHHALVDRAQLKAGETVLVLGAAGGVGTAAIQIAKAVGARVIAAASSDEKCALCRTLGADASINYTSADLREQIKAATEGKGPDVVYDPVGGAMAEPVFRSIAWRGRYLVIGFAAGAIPALPLNLALLKGASLVGVFWGEFAKREPQQNARALNELASWYAQGRIKPVIEHRYALRDLPRAFELMASRQVRGKIVLSVD